LVIWITGLSGAGKTTLSSTLYRLLKPAIPELVYLDGDVVRAAFGHNLGHTEADRVKQVQRLQAMSRVLADQDLVVLVAVLYSHPDLLAWNRSNMKEYFEVYIDVSLETVRRRDQKGLYAKADTGHMKDVVGLDIPWHAPQRPDLRIDGDAVDTPENWARRVIAAVPRLRSMLPGKPRP
jgi:cytidine diphosphoramidate kinase